MTSRDFCYWLQGFFELNNKKGGFTPEQAEMIRRHLSMVFLHEIDPSSGDEKHQQELNTVHRGGGDPPRIMC
jgi:CRISPR/Cas system type I-B associated protein Csh2 (Cas7 group RAMP superfamily)